MLGACSTNSGRLTQRRTVVTAQSCGGTCPALQRTISCTPVPIQCQVCNSIFYSIKGFYAHGPELLWVSFQRWPKDPTFSANLVHIHNQYQFKANEVHTSTARDPEHADLDADGRITLSHALLRAMHAF